MPPEQPNYPPQDNLPPEDYVPGGYYPPVQPAGVSNKEKFLVLAVICLGLLGAFYLIMSGPFNTSISSKTSSTPVSQKAEPEPDNKTSQKEAAQSNPPKASTSTGSTSGSGLEGFDKERARIISYQALFQISAITAVMGGTPDNSEAIYNYFKTKNVKQVVYKDPKTNNELRYVDSRPQRDEMQYAAQQYCAKDYKGLGPMSTGNAAVYSLVILLEDNTLFCNSNLPTPN